MKRVPPKKNAILLSPKEETGVGKTLFQVKTPLNFNVRTTVGYWKIITTVKHPSMAGKESEIKRCLSNPDEVRLSKRDKGVYLFYRRLKEKHVCVVVRREREWSYIITTYVTDKIKEGEAVWKKIRLYYDSKGNTLNVWFDDPRKEHLKDYLAGTQQEVLASSNNLYAIQSYGIQRTDVEDK
jgi:hypothetical protein